MKKAIKRRLAAISARRALSSRHAHGGFAAEGPAAVFAPTSHGSFGDEALVLGTGFVLEKLGRPWTLMAPGAPEPWRMIGVDTVSATEEGLSQGGVSWEPPQGQKYGSAVVIGADSIDFSYGVRNASAKLSALNRAASSGRPATLFNFSLRATLDPIARDLLTRLHPDVRICTRDPLTQERARRLFERDDIAAAPDVAIFLEPRQTPASSSIEDWASGRRVAALTVNNHLGVNFSSRDMLQYFVGLGRVLIDAGFDVMVLAHDVREEQDDPGLARAVAAELGSGASAATPADAREAKAMLTHMSVHVTSRMHAGVASLSQGVPTVGLDYVDKFRGQFSWYGAGDYVVPWTSPDVTERVKEMVDQVGRDVGLKDALERRTENWKADASVWGLR